MKTLRCFHVPLPSGPVRLPMVDATDAQTEQLRADAALAGVQLPERS